MAKLIAGGRKQTGAGSLFRRTTKTSGVFRKPFTPQRRCVVPKVRMRLEKQVVLALRACQRALFILIFSLRGNS